MHQEAEIAVIGAGIIGLATAFRLVEEGRDVLSIDADLHPVRASAGNAGAIAPFNCVPVGSPTTLRSLPHLLAHADSPFAMRWAALPALTPWLIRFVRQSLPRQARANAAALAPLLHDSLAAWHELAAAIGTADLLRVNGCLYVFPSQSAFAATRWDQAQRTAGGVRELVIGSEEVMSLEPALINVRGPGVFFPDAAHVVDPAEMLSRLRTAAEARGMRSLTARIQSLQPGRDKIKLNAPGVSVDANRAVIAAGAWSRPLARQAGDHIPLDTERGYHVEYGMQKLPLSRPVCAAEFGVYLTPMAGRLRAAGTVELGGLHRCADPRRNALVDRAARTLLADLPAPTSEWMGFRPSLPDSLPVLGRARYSDRIIYAFGHGHLGLTLAALTAQKVVRLLREDGHAEPMMSCSPQRFG
jgi:D-hydroxyproline dehydrogenase